MAFDLSEYVTVAERIELAMTKWPDASFQNIATKLIDVGGHFYVEATVALYRDPNDVRPAIATAWEPIPGATPYTKDSEMMNAETSAMGRACIAAGIASKSASSADDSSNRRKTVTEIVRGSKQEPTEDDPWATTPTVTSQGKAVPNCKHGPRNHWVSPRSGQAFYFCSLDQKDPDYCPSVKA